ncbi:hypothetical protein DB345_13650 [Spartobacteria bacterium LR76]|nr:hypothetical protein DB345_13650 [Spartobacteria bacterium LR76]
MQIPPFVAPCAGDLPGSFTSAVGPQVRRVFLPPTGDPVDGNIQMRHPAERGSWIWHPARDPQTTAILRFRLRFVLEEPARPLIHVTADQRFQLRCDGADVTFGPDRCDEDHWTVQSVELTLPAGEHELEALVWRIVEPSKLASRIDPGAGDVVNDVVPPMAQMSWKGGFLLVAENAPAVQLDTGRASWMVEDLTGAVAMRKPRIPGYHDIGPEFHFDMERWHGGESVAAGLVLGPLEPNVYGVRRPGWCLYPSEMPEQSRQAWTGGMIRALRSPVSANPWTLEELKAAEIPQWQALLDGGSLTVAPHSELVALWDLGIYRCGYPVLECQGGQGSVVELSWTESLYEEKTPEEVLYCSPKGNRGEVVGKVFVGIGDSWKIGSLPVWTSPSLWWRCGRYVQITVRTAETPLTLGRLGLNLCGFPLGAAVPWKSSDAEWDNLMPIFENAFRIAAHETWTDTPYYEQMCYVGDNALTALSNYAIFANTAISRRSIQLYDWSRRAGGFTAERYPSAWRQECPTYCLIWPMMIRDYAMWRDEPGFVRRMLPGMRCVLAEFEARVGADGLLHRLPGWSFIDWVPEWDTGCGPGVWEGDSSIVNLQWVLALLAAAEVEEAHGDLLLARRNREWAERVFAATLDRYWDEKRGLLRDTTLSDLTSEHAQAFALVTGLMDPARAARCLAALRNEPGMAKTSIYASFYLLEALYLQGEEEEFHRQLAFWRGLPALGFTSTPEQPEPTRSDSHPWGAHPAWHTLASIAGVRPAAPGFAKVRIAPQPHEMEWLECSVRHPQGEIALRLQFAGGKAQGEIHLPGSLSGEFVWKGAVAALQPGANTVAL